MNLKILRYVDMHLLSFFFILSALLIAIYVALGYLCLNTLYDIGCYCAVFLLGLVFLSEKKYLAICVYAFSIICIFMAFWGILQYVGWLPSGNGLFAVTGVFDNPAGIGMFQAILLPYIMYLRKQEKKSIQIMRWMGIFVVAIVILLSESRTGVLAACAGFICLYAKKINKKYVIILVILGLLACIFLYLYKPASANGRLFISWISVRLAIRHLWIGYGMDGFDKGYMLEQAAFFVQFPHSTWAQVADNVRQPFNEYLLFLIRFGVIGILSLTIASALLLRQIYRNYSEDKLPAIASLCACVVCGCFSYPSHYVLIILSAIISLAISCAPLNKEFIVSQRKPMSIKIVAVLMLVTVIFGQAYNYYHYESVRKHLEDRSFDGEKSNSLNRDYEIIYQTDYFHRHAVFLYNYALHLYENEQYVEALTVWEQYFSCRHDYDGQLMYAYTLTQLSCFKQAIEAFKLASFMLPSRLQPHYELICLYERMGEKEKAFQCAKEAFIIPLKVHNLKTEYLHNKIKEYMEHLK